MTLALVSRRSALLPGRWVSNELWRRARAVPSLDLRFAENKSLVDAITGANLVTFTRASAGTYVDSQGVVRTATTDAPRFDHNPTTGESLGLLVEEQRVNLALQSEDFSTTWVTSQLTVTTNAIASPAGAITADALYETAVNNEHRIRQFFTGLTANINYTTSVYIKDLGGRNLGIRVLDTDNVANGYLAVFSPVSGTVVVAATSLGSGVAASASITPLAGGWYRVVLTGNAGATCTKYILDFFSYSGTSSSFAGDVTKGLYLWGAQLEAGSFPTSYIPTTTSAVTRAADVASISGSNFSGWYRQDEGTVFAEGSSFSATSGSRVLAAIDDLSMSNRFQITLGGGYTPNFAAVSAGAVSADLYAAALTQGVNTRLCSTYRVNDFALSSNGGNPVTDTSGALPVSVSTARLGVFQNNASYLNGTIRRITYFPQRLPNNVLQALTQ